MAITYLSQFGVPGLGARLRAYPISGELLKDWFTTGRHHMYYGVEDGIPADARVVAVMCDPTYLTVSIVVEHHSFEPVHEGCAIPNYSVTTTT